MKWVYSARACLMAAAACVCAATGAVAGAHPVGRVPMPFTTDPYPSTYQPLPRTDMLIVGATILDGAGQRIEDGDVLVRGGRIAAVGHGLKVSGVAVIDA